MENKPASLLCPWQDIKGPSINTSAVRGKGGWFFICGRPNFLVQKTSEFSKFLVCPHRQERLSQCGQGGGGRFYAILCGHLIMDGP